MVVHDDGKVRGRLLQLQQAQHRREEAISYRRVLPRRRRQPLCTKAKVRAVQERMCVHKDEPVHAASHAFRKAA